MIWAQWSTPVIPATWEAKAAGMQVPGQPQQLSENLSQGWDQVQWNTPVIPVTWEAETGGSQVQGQPQQLSKTQSQENKTK